jgi:hypothetical protein
MRSTLQPVPAPPSLKERSSPPTAVRRPLRGSQCANCVRRPEARSESRNPIEEAVVRRYGREWPIAHDRECGAAVADPWRRSYDLGRRPPSRTPSGAGGSNSDPLSPSQWLVADRSGACARRCCPGTELLAAVGLLRSSRCNAAVPGERRVLLAWGRRRLLAAGWALGLRPKRSPRASEPHDCPRPRAITWRVRGFALGAP